MSFSTFAAEFFGMADAAKKFFFSKRPPVSQARKKQGPRKVLENRLFQLLDPLCILMKTFAGFPPFLSSSALENSFGERNGFSFMTSLLICLSRGGAEINPKQSLCLASKMGMLSVIQGPKIARGLCCAVRSWHIDARVQLSKRKEDALLLLLDS